MESFILIIAGTIVVEEGRAVSNKVEELEGVGAILAQKLNAVGIKTTDDLLEHCATAKGRESVAAKSGLSETQLLKWANMADLMRVSGIGGEFSELLEAAGVDTVKELRTRNADNLAAKMAEVNAAKKLTRRVPTSAQVAKWIDAAKAIEPKISH
jgi:predicted flap endonuclease-1-like 5' DNA nuclease